MKNLRLVTDGTAPSRLLQEHSAARLHLAKLISQRLAIEDRLRALAEAGGKLQEAADADRHAGAALNGLDAEEATAMAAWAQNSSGPMPVFDQTRRQKLRAAVDAAAAQASAARKAAAANGAKQTRENSSLKSVEAQIALAIVPVIVQAMSTSEGRTDFPFKVTFGPTPDARRSARSAASFCSSRTPKARPGSAHGCAHGTASRSDISRHTLLRLTLRQRPYLSG